MNKASTELIGKNVTAKVHLVRYRFPTSRKAILEGGSSIIVVGLTKMLEGELPKEFSKGGSNEFVIKGYDLPLMERDVDYIFHGKLVNDPAWGLQYDVKNMYLDYDPAEEKDPDKFFRFFLSEGQIKALHTVDGNPVKLLEERRLKDLQKIKGVGPVTALKMCNKYEECKMNARAYVVFGDLGLTKKAIEKIVAHYHSVDNAIAAVTENPYVLIKEVRGYGWAKADAIAQAKGFAKDSQERIMAYTLYFLRDQAEANGNSCVPIEDLVDAVSQECAPAPKDIIAQYIKEDMANIDIFERYMQDYGDNFSYGPHPSFFYDKETRKVGLFDYRVMERSIFNELKRLKEAPLNPAFDIAPNKLNKIIKECEEEQGFEYTEEQRNAINLVLNNNVSVITSGAGGGKTTTLKPLVRIIQERGLMIAQTAFAGRAAAMLSSVTQIDGKTIHRLLKYQADTGHFCFNHEDQMPYDVVILDETSMVGGELFLSLISAIKSGCKFVMLGDIKQLPPMSVGNVFFDCLQSGFLATQVLTKIHRQAAKSGIITQAIHVSAGESIAKNSFRGSETRGELQDFTLTAASDATFVNYEITKQFKEWFLNQKIPINQIQVISPLKSRGESSCRALNEAIQQIANPYHENEAVLVPMFENGMHYTVKLKPHDKVIVTRNNYNAIDVNGQKRAVFNGNLGVITSCSEKAVIVKIEGEDEDIIFTGEELRDLSLAYAITCHKLQGGQAPYVIIGIDSTAYALLSRELVYTAITRAMKKCVLVAQPTALNTAVHTSSIKTKITWLKDEFEKARRVEDIGDF